MTPNVVTRPGVLSADSSLVQPHPEDEASFRRLKRLIKKAGLLDKKPRYYIGKLIQGGLLLALSVWVLARFDSLWVQVPNAVLLAFAFTQLGMIGHDAGHRQVFASGRHNKALGQVLLNLVLGFSHRWWVDKHNRHHNHPNHLDHDPDIQFPIVVFAPQQAADKPPVSRWFIRRQAYWFIPLLFLLSFSLWRDTFLFLWQHRRDATWHREWALEVVLIALHAVLYVGLLWWCLGPRDGLIFGLVHLGFLGLFLGSIFAANHKGMPLLDHGVELDFIRRQVLTSRNIRRHPVGDYWHGPLGNQIEHHLFPAMPRCNLRRAETIVKSYCADNDIPYHEAGTFASYGEILRHLHQVSLSLRRT